MRSELSPLGKSLLREARAEHPTPWRCEGPRVLDARGGVVLRCDGNLAAVALALGLLDDTARRSVA